MEENAAWPIRSSRNAVPTRSSSKRAKKSYSWCACGRSAHQPFCDGSHAGTGLAPMRFECTASGAHYLCGCKQTSDKPFCDGTHDTLE
jgi:CDGSH-type Zn-finger protein